jgi:hypothetical protein
MHGTFLYFADEVSVITLRLGTLQSSAHVFVMKRSNIHLSPASWFTKQNDVFYEQESSLPRS